MDDIPNHESVPVGWLEVLAESEADLAAGRIVPGDVLMRDLHQALARLDAKAASTLAHEVKFRP